MVLFLIPVLVGCKPKELTLPTVDPTEIQTEIPPEPTPTNAPSAASVNSENIPLDFFEGELARYEATVASMALPEPTEDTARYTVISDLIDQVLLKQGAAAAGYTVSDEDYQNELSRLVDDLGNEDALKKWIDEQGYDDIQFEFAMRLSMAASWQKQQIADSIPEAVPQVHARQIFAYTSEGAQRAQTSLKSGTDFDEIAWTYDPVSGGDLSWFPRGYLTVLDVEVAAFALPVGGVSEIITSELGYHIVKVLEVDEVHPLTSDARITLQRNALYEWLRVAREQAQIIIEY